MSTGEHVSRVRRLYKLIFRVHRALPAELRVLGDNYAREEFKRHKNCNQQEAKVFINEWTGYVMRLARQMKAMAGPREEGVGAPLDPTLLDHMTDDQVLQLYELHKATSKPPEKGEPPVSDKQEPIKETIEDEQNKKK